MKNTLLKLIAVIAMLGATLPARAQGQEWKDPGTIIDQIKFEGTKAREVGDFFRAALKDEIDVIVPATLAEKPISLRLKNVTATEAFNAMNQLFAAGLEPIKWDLSMSGKRPTATLHIFRNEPAPAQTPQKAGVFERTAIFYIGDLLGDTKDGGLSVKEIEESILGVITATGKRSKEFKTAFHDATQLLIVSGAPDEIKLARTVVDTLRLRAQSLRFNKQHNKTVEPAKP